MSLQTAIIPQHIVLEGETLGERRRHYNRLLKDALLNTQIFELKGIDHGDNDLDNLIRIDIASASRNYHYILEVLKCDDMLYISRALNKCKWLITDTQYAHIVNPSYLHRNMFPHMNMKAIKKLMLLTRINLKDEKRIKAFYLYYLNVNPKAALKWLVNCSSQYILRAIERHGRDIPVPLLKRFCRKSPEALAAYFGQYQTDRRDVLSSLLFLARSSTDVYLDVIENTQTYYLNDFGAKATRRFLKKYPDRILNNFAHYANNIDVPTFVKYLKTHVCDPKVFLLKEADKGKQEWFNFDVLKHFVKEIPRDETFELLKTIFGITNKDLKISELFYAIEKSDNMTACKVYRWYEVVPFNIAKHELRKLIYAESSPEERESMLSVLLACAEENPQLIQDMLHYYHEKHINEPYKFKIPFINNLIGNINIYKFDEKTWNLLDDIFHSMEVYIKSENVVTYCLDSIIIYKVLHDQEIPDIIKEKFQFDNLQYAQSKLNEVEKGKVFDYLYGTATNWLYPDRVTNEAELTENVKHLETIWNLVKSWKKEKHYYQNIIEKIKELMYVRSKIPSTMNISTLYIMMGRWRKHLFSDSLSLCVSDETCVNALKHDSRLLTQYSSEMTILRKDDSVVPSRLLSKLRIYWPNSLAKEWADAYFTHINDTTGQKARIKGLNSILPPGELINFVTKHAPVDKKRTAKGVEVDIHLRKLIAKNMHSARPALPLDIVLQYAKGGITKCTQLSLNAICNNQKSAYTREHIRKLVNGPVSLQKHGIRLAFRKLKAEELIPISRDVWKSTKNRTIRELTFTMTFELLCTQKKHDLIKELWQLFNSFIDELTYDENEKIYDIFSGIDRVPVCIRAEFYIKSYMFTRNLPETVASLVKYNVVRYAVNIIEHLDTDFVMNVLLDSVFDKFLKSDYTDTEIISVYILSTKDEKLHIDRCEKILDPILNQCLSKRNSSESYKVKYSIENFLKHLCRVMPTVVFDKKMVVPVLAFTKIYEYLKQIWTIETDYKNLTCWKLIAAFTKVLDELNKASENGLSWIDILNKSLPYFAVICKNQLKQDMDQYFSSIYLMFGDAIQLFFQTFNIHDDDLKMDLIELLIVETVPETYLMALQILPRHIWNDETKSKQRNLRRMIYLQGTDEVKMHYLDSFSE